MAKYFIAFFSVLGFVLLTVTIFGNGVDWGPSYTPMGDHGTATLRLKARGDDKIEVQLVKVEGFSLSSTSLSLRHLEDATRYKLYKQPTRYAFNEEGRAKSRILIEPGSWVFRVGTSIFVEGLGSASRSVEVKEGETRDLTFKLRRVKHYQVRFVDEAGVELPTMTRQRYSDERRGWMESIEPQLNGEFFLSSEKKSLSFDATGGKVAISLSNGNYMVGESNRLVVDLDATKDEVITIPCVPAPIQVVVVYKAPGLGGALLLNWPKDSEHKHSRRPIYQRDGLPNYWEGNGAHLMNFVRPGRYMLDFRKPGVESDSPVEHPECEIVISDYTTRQVWEWRGLEEGFVRLQ